jgi:hypothetical protein
MLAAFRLLALAAGARCVLSAPTKIEERQAPQGVPDYVLKYGQYIYFLLALAVFLGLG